MAVFVSEQKLAETRGLTIGQVRDIKARRGLTTEVFGAMPERVLRQLLRRLPLGDLPRLRAAFRYRQSRDDRGIVPHHAFMSALEQKRRVLPPSSRPGGPRLQPSPQHELRRNRSPR